jgi:hypothetical protein
MIDVGVSGREKRGRRRVDWLGRESRLDLFRLEMVGVFGGGVVECRREARDPVGERVLLLSHRDCPCLSISQTKAELSVRHIVVSVSSSCDLPSSLTLRRARLTPIILLSPLVFTRRRAC